MQDLVSIIITTYSGSYVLERAIKSVQQQTYKSLEIIVVDDNNPESEERKKTEKVMNKFSKDNSVKYFRHERNMNGSVARNTGIKNANGRFIAFLDDDDIYMPSRIEKCVNILKNNSEYNSVLTGVIVTDGIQVIDIIEQKSHDDPLRDMFFGNPLGTGSNMFFTRSAIEYLNGFDVSFLRRQDVEFMVRFYKHFKSAYIHENLAVKVVQKRPNININYKKFVKIEKQFISTFSNIIYSYLDNEDRFNYLNHTYTVLFRMALVSSSKDTRMATVDLRKIRKLTVKEKIFAKFSTIYRICRYNPILYGIKVKSEQKKNNIRISQLLPFVDAKEIQFMKNYKVIKSR